MTNNGIAYTPSPLELRISQGYKQNQIVYPQDMNIEKVADLCHIQLKFADVPSFHYKNEYFQCIVINKKLSIEKQREHFFHELSHVLKHSGSQLDMPDFKRKWQEMKTKTFISYASIPVHMLSYIDFYDPYVVNKTAEMFRITPDIAHYRLWKIRQQNMGGINNGLYS